MGIRVAVHEINSHGGILGGRPLILETKDDRSVPARAIENLKEFAAVKDLVAVFGARFSPGPDRIETNSPKTGYDPSGPLGRGR